MRTVNFCHGHSSSIQASGLALQNCKQHRQVSAWGMVHESTNGPIRCVAHPTLRGLHLEDIWTFIVPLLLPDMTGPCTGCTHGESDRTFQTSIPHGICWTWCRNLTAPTGLPSLAMGRGEHWPWPLADTCPSTLSLVGDRIQWCASVRRVFDWLALLAPTLSVCSHADKVLGIDAWVYLSPSHAQHVGHLLPKVLVVHDPWRPNKLLAHLHNSRHVGHEAWPLGRVLRFDSAAFT